MASDGAIAEALRKTGGNAEHALALLIAGAPMFNVMSITKAAIGLCYHHARVPRDRALPGLEGVTVGQALQNTTGYPDSAWDFEAFRAVVDDPEGDLLAFALERLSSLERGPPGDFEYNNLMWQVLASSYEDLAGRTLRGTLSFLIGRTGWYWDMNNAQPTGPSGLWMTRAAAERLGHAALVVDLPVPQPIPKGVFGHLEAGFDGYINGWFTRGDALIAVGWRVQFVVVKGDGEVLVHLVDDDFTGERPDEEWDFVRRALEQRDGGQA